MIYCLHVFNFSYPYIFEAFWYCSIDQFKPVHQDGNGVVASIKSRFFIYLNKRKPVPLLPLAGQTLYGRVLWNPEQNLNAAYKLQLEKVYLCTGKDGYVPFFDPTGTLYNEGPQYGCIQPNKHLKHRFLLLVQLFLFYCVWSMSSKVIISY